jgi:hypothetical protein
MLRQQNFTPGSKRGSVRSSKSLATLRSLRDGSGNSRSDKERGTPPSEDHARVLSTLSAMFHHACEDYALDQEAIQKEDEAMSNSLKAEREMLLVSVSRCHASGLGMRGRSSVKTQDRSSTDSTGKKFLSNALSYFGLGSKMERCTSLPDSSISSSEDTDSEDLGDR